MDFVKKISDSMAKVEEELSICKEKLSLLEKDFADVKLNPYGITSIDFSQRQDLIEDRLKMEGVLMGLQLAKDTYEESLA